MSSTVTKDAAPPQTAGDWESSRREKLERIVALGRDPWGARFDDHAPIAAIRAQAS
jgi:lysyl-tRNA synthetase class 2